MLNQFDFEEWIPKPDDCLECGGSGDEFIGYSDNNGESVFRPCTKCNGTGKIKNADGK